MSRHITQSSIDPLVVLQTFYISSTNRSNTYEVYGVLRDFSTFSLQYLGSNDSVVLPSWGSPSTFTSDFTFRLESMILVSQHTPILVVTSASTSLAVI